MTDADYRHLFEEQSKEMSALQTRILDLKTANQMYVDRIRELKADKKIEKAMAVVVIGVMLFAVFLLCRSFL